MRDSMPATLLFLFLSLALLGTTILASEFSDTWEESTGVQQIQLASSDMNEALAKKQGMNANAKVISDHLRFVSSPLNCCAARYHETSSISSPVLRAGSILMRWSPTKCRWLGGR